MPLTTPLLGSIGGDIGTWVGAAALVLGGSLALLQLQAGRRSGEEEMLLRLAKVFHDTIPAKRRVAAGLLTRLRSATPTANCVDDVTPEEANCLADVLRFFETVKFAMSALELTPIKFTNWPLVLLERLGRIGDAGVSDPVAMEFGRYASGYACALGALGDQALRELMVKVLPRHGPTADQTVAIVCSTLKTIAGHAKESQGKLAGGSTGSPAPGAEQGEAVPAFWSSEPLIYRGFPGWSEAQLSDFLQRETQVKAPDEWSYTL